ncbi:polysaccharide deacetylase family protein [Sphaerotilaceae bacterium SBD11-9]
MSAVALLCACSSTPTSPNAAPAPVPATSNEGVIARNDRWLIYMPQAQDSTASIAARFLGSSQRDWEIAEANDGAKLRTGYPVIVPLKPANPTGVKHDRYQTIPILCYHRVGNSTSKMTVSSAAFAEQLEWLVKNDYRVLRLQDVAAFIDGKQAVPARSVVLTFDDGYESYYRYAYPLLKKHGMPATVFLYSDFVGAADALTWAQMQEMTASGLIDIQAHSKTHANLINRLRDEADAAYRQRIDLEVRAPRELIERRLKQPVKDFAYPYGDANEIVLDALSRSGYRLGVTVNPGGTPFFGQPFMLRRTMIYGNHDLDAFKARLQISRPVTLP